MTKILSALKLVGLERRQSITAILIKHESRSRDEGAPKDPEDDSGHRAASGILKRLTGPHPVLITKLLNYQVNTAPSQFDNPPPAFYFCLR